MGKYGPFPKTWYNKLGIYKIYEEKELKENWYFFELSSHDEENKPDSGNILTIGFLRKYRKWKLPFKLIKPIFDYNTYEYAGNDYYQIGYKKLTEMNLPIKWKNYVVNEYRLAFWDSNFALYLNAAEQLIHGKHKPLVSFLWNYPWKIRTRTKYLLLNTDKSLFFDYSKRNNLNVINNFEPEDTQPFKIFSFKDFDNEIINAKCTLSYSEYTLGESKFMKNCFKLIGIKPEKYYTLDINFDKEVGKGKGSWKGGTIGHSIDLEVNDTIEDGFRKYCSVHKLTFIGENFNE